MIIPSSTTATNVSSAKTADAAQTDNPINANRHADTKTPSSQIKDIPESEKRQLQRLQVRDREVRAHEAAHVAAGGALTSPASYKYQTGPDGKRYAVGGEVSIDTSAVPNDPRATLTKAQKIRDAALAPVTPSNQDRAVATKAAVMAAKAGHEIRTEDENPENQTNDIRKDQAARQDARRVAGDPDLTKQQPPAAISSYRSTASLASPEQNSIIDDMI